MKFVLYNNIKIVEGPVNSVVVDTQYHQHHVVNDSFVKIITSLNNYSLEELEKSYDENEKLVFRKFVQNLVDEGFGFIAKNPKDFIVDNLNGEIPFFYGRINTAIVEIGNENFNNILISLKGLFSLGCRFLEIRCYNDIGRNKLETLFKLFQDSSISSIRFIVVFSEIFRELDFIVSFCRKYYRISDVLVFNSPFEKEFKNRLFRIRYQLSKLDEKCCGMVVEDNFSNSPLFYAESQSWNTCLNKKISIDKNGNIKNCPSMIHSFGNIKDTTFEEALNHPDFKKLWNINKDKIHVCKDCEFRHICTDCRAYIEDPEDILSKPLKCGYNPYTGEWSEWSTNPLKQKAIKHYGMEELVKIS